MISVKFFAGARMERDDRVITAPATQRRRLALLALLAAHHPAGVSRERLIGYLWPDRDAEHARNLLSQSVYALRRTLGDEAVVAAGDELRLDPDVVPCDVIRFAQAVSAGEMDHAAALYAGPFLDGFFFPARRNSSIGSKAPASGTAARTARRSKGWRRTPQRRAMPHARPNGGVAWPGKTPAMRASHCA